jgi:hypothetical protein
LQVGKAAQQLVAVDGIADANADDAGLVVVGTAEAKDAGDAGDDDDIVAAEQAGGGA